VRRTQQFGARIVLAGEGSPRRAFARARSPRSEGLTLVPSVRRRAHRCGPRNGGLEFLHDVPDLDVLLVPIGGGGLIAGIAIAAKALRPSLEIVGVQTRAVSVVLSRSSTACRRSTAARRSPKASR
jgi:threonine dehydratase